MIEKWLENDGIPVQKFKDACVLAKILLDNGNAVMITQEEDLFIVNWVWCESGYADRNDVVFRDRASVEFEMLQCIEKDSTELSKSAEGE